jgi:hypothetical protein
MNSSPIVFGFVDSNVPFNEILQNQHGKTGCDKIRKEARDVALTNNDTTFSFDNRVWKPNEWYLTEEFITSAEVDRFGREMASHPCAQLQKDPPHGPLDMAYLQLTGVAPPFEKAGHPFYAISIGAGTKQLVQLPWYQAREKAFNVNWHPGPLGHTLIASSMAHFFLTNLKGALSENRLSKGPSADNPLVGKPIVGKLQEPQCGSLKVNQCKTGMSPTSKGTTLRESRLSHNSDDTWDYTISMQVSEGHTETVDKRWVFRGNETSGELRLNFVAPNDGMYVILCGAPCGWKCTGNAGYVSSMSQRWWPEDGPARKSVSDLKFSIDGNGIQDKDLPKLHETLFSKEAGKFCPGCDKAADLCQPLAKVDAGQHTIGASVKPRSWEGADKNTFVEIMELLVVG